MNGALALKLLLVLVLQSLPQNYGQLKHMRKHSRDHKLRRELPIKFSKLLTDQKSSNVTSALTSKGSISSPVNLLLVLTDQWRFSALGSTPFRVRDFGIKTPELDAFAATAIVFSKAFTANPVCTPARASLLTGRFSHEHGLTTTNLALPIHARTLAGILRDGPWQYHTVYEGKWHLDGDRSPGYVPRGWRRQGFTVMEGFNRGHRYFEVLFDLGAYFTDSGQHRTLPSNVFEPKFQVSRAVEQLKSFRYARRQYYRRNSTISEPKPRTLVSSGLTSGIGEDNEGEFEPHSEPPPWFLMLSLGPPHDPFVPPPKFMNHQRRIRWRANVDFANTTLHHSNGVIDRKQAKGTLEPKHSAENELAAVAMIAEARTNYKGYLGLCEAVDAEYGRLMMALEKYGFADDTIVVFTSDHGDMMYGHGDRKIHKNSFFDESLRVPLLMRLPNHIRRVGEFPEPVSLADLTPTLLGIIHSNNPRPSLFLPSSESSVLRRRSLWSTRCSETNNSTTDSTTPVDANGGGVCLNVSLRTMSGKDLSALILSMPQQTSSLSSSSVPKSKNGRRSGISSSTPLASQGAGIEEEEIAKAATVHASWAGALPQLFVVSQGAMTAPLAPDHLRLFRLATARAHAVEAGASLEGGNGDSIIDGGTKSTNETDLRNPFGAAGDVDGGADNGSSGVEGAFLDSGGSCGVMSYTVRPCGEWRAVVSKRFKLVVLRLLGAETNGTLFNETLLSNNYRNGSERNGINITAKDKESYRKGIQDDSGAALSVVAHPAFLFDNERDPFELHNAIDDPHLKAVKAKLLGHLAAWLERTKDPFPHRRAVSHDVYSDRDSLQHPRSVAAGSVDVVALAAMGVPIESGGEVDVVKLEESGSSSNISFASSPLSARTSIKRYHARKMLSTRNPCWERPGRRQTDEHGHVADRHASNATGNGYACFPLGYLSHAPFAVGPGQWQAFVELLSRHPQVTPPDDDPTPDWWGTWMRTEEKEAVGTTMVPTTIMTSLELLPQARYPPGSSISPLLSDAPTNVALASLDKYLDNFRSAARDIVLAHEKFGSNSRYERKRESGGRRRGRQGGSGGRMGLGSGDAVVKTNVKRKKRLSFDEFQRYYGIGTEREGDESESFNEPSSQNHLEVIMDNIHVFGEVTEGITKNESTSTDNTNPEDGAKTESNNGARNLSTQNLQGNDRKRRRLSGGNRTDLNGIPYSASLASSSPFVVREVVTFDASPGTIFTFGANDLTLAEAIASIQPEAKFVLFAASGSNSFKATGEESDYKVANAQRHLDRLWKEFTAGLRLIRDKTLVAHAKQQLSNFTSRLESDDCYKWLWHSPSLNSETSQPSTELVQMMALSFAASLRASLDRWEECRFHDHDNDYRDRRGSHLENDGESDNTAAQCLKALTTSQRTYSSLASLNNIHERNIYFFKGETQRDLFPHCNGVPASRLLLRERALCFGRKGVQHWQSRYSPDEATELNFGVGESSAAPGQCLVTDSVPLVVPLSPWLCLEERILATWLVHFRPEQFLVVDIENLPTANRATASVTDKVNEVESSGFRNALARICRFLGLDDSSGVLDAMFLPLLHSTIIHKDPHSPTGVEALLALKFESFHRLVRRVTESSSRGETDGRERSGTFSHGGASELEKAWRHSLRSLNTYLVDEGVGFSEALPNDEESLSSPPPPPKLLGLLARAIRLKDARPSADRRENALVV